ncbi:MAG: xylose isomerase [Ferruginibacter sp.]|nr:xylose isomerase [Ferruginibacter sp.]
MKFIKMTSIIVSLSFLMLMITANAQDNQLSKKEKKEGWQLLFDGKTSTGWKGAFIDKFPAKGWKIDQGLLMVEPSGGAESTNGGDIVTLKEYGNFELSANFKLTEGANSGIKYFVDAKQPTPTSPRSAFGLEFQVLDDAKHPDAKLGKNGNRTLSSVYDLIPAISSKPAKAIGEWNTAKIVSNGQHVEHWLNGVMVVAYERGSETYNALVGGSKYKDVPGFGLKPTGRILLQDHGNKVFFKNIKIRETKFTPDTRSGKLLKEIPGVVSYTFRKSFQSNPAATLDSIKALGITNIEFSNLFGKTAAELRKLLDERGMRCTSFGIGYPDLINNIRKVGENAKTLGASFVRVAWIPHEKVPFTIEIAKKAVEDFNTAGKILKDEFGLTFCYHNHGYEFQPYENGTYFDYIMANTKPEYVSFELDILWAFHPGKDPVELLKQYPKRFKLMHVKDLRKGVEHNFSGGTPVENDVALGSGQINIEAVIRAAQKSAIQYYYIEDESNDVNIQVPVSLALLKSF